MAFCLICRITIWHAVASTTTASQVQSSTKDIIVWTGGGASMLQCSFSLFIQPQNLGFGSYQQDCALLHWDHVLFSPLRTNPPKHHRSSHFALCSVPKGFDVLQARQCVSALIPASALFFLWKHYPDDHQLICTSHRRWLLRSKIYRLGLKMKDQKPA